MRKEKVPTHILPNGGETSWFILLKSIKKSPTQPIQVGKKDEKGNHTHNIQVNEGKHFQSPSYKKPCSTLFAAKWLGASGPEPFTKATPIVSWLWTTAHVLHPRKLTWIPKMMVWKRWFLLNMAIFGIHVIFLGCTYHAQESSSLEPKPSHVWCNFPTLPVI